MHDKIATVAATVHYHHHGDPNSWCRL